MRKNIIFILLVMVSVSVSAQDCYYMKKAKGYLREAEYYTKKAEGYDREAEYYNKVSHQ